MELKNFITTIDLEDAIIEKVEVNNNSLYLYIGINIEMNYIANGCRPFFDYIAHHLCVFTNQDCTNIDITSLHNSIITKIDFQNSILHLYLNNGNELIITPCDVEIHQNIELSKL